MQTIQIQAEQFFELLKLKDTSMWEIFAQMIDGNEKEIIFLDEEEKYYSAIFCLPIRKSWRKTERNFRNSLRINWRILIEF